MRKALNPARFGRHAPAGFARRLANRRHIGARAEVIVIGQAIAAQLQLVDLALHHRSFGATKFTAATHPLLGRSWFGSGLALKRSCFDIYAYCDDQRAERKRRNAKSQQALVRIAATQRAGKTRKSHKHA